MKYIKNFKFCKQIERLFCESFLKMKLSKSEQLKVVEEYIASKKSIPEFSKESGYSLGQITYWVRKYKDEKRSKEPKGKTSFIKVTSTSSNKIATPPITIKYPNGVIVETPDGLVFEQLAQLINLKG